MNESPPYESANASATSTNSYLNYASVPYATSKNSTKTTYHDEENDNTKNKPRVADNTMEEKII